MAGNEKIGLAPINLSDGPTGVRGLKFTGGRVVDAVPQRHPAVGGLEQATPRTRWAGCSPRRRMAQDIHVVLGPTINLHRTALGGRLFEAYSEDPLLTGRLAAAYVRGPAGAPASAPASSTWSPTSRRPTATP